MRLDKYLSALELYSRRQSAPLIKKWVFLVNGEVVKRPEYELVEGDMLARENQEIIVKTRITLLIYKPAGYVSSDVDEYGRPSYKKLLADVPYTPLLHIAGRLDVDTEGLIIASSDGQLVHKIISPKHHLPKTYLVTTRDALDQKQCDRLAAGVYLDDMYHTLPAQATLIDEHHLTLVLTEGKYHQVKRMLVSVGNEVVHLQRVALWPRNIADLQGKPYIEIEKTACIDLWLV
jgi:16S rRNA pseudouridine516 synthase